MTSIFIVDRGDLPRGTPEIFFQAVKQFRGDAYPAFVSMIFFMQNSVIMFGNLFFKNKEGVNFIFAKFPGLYFVLATTRNVSPMLSFELLSRLHKVGMQRYMCPFPR